MMDNRNTQKSTLLKDFEDFRSNPSVDSRYQLAQRICLQYNNLEFSNSESQVIQDILLVLSLDVEKKIRISIAQSLKDNPTIPHALAKKIAHDISEVSSPILEFSDVLTDADLHEIIHSTGEVIKLNSIAKRKDVSENISYALIEKQIDEVVVNLMNNPTAKIDYKCQEKCFELFKKSSDILENMVQRGGLNPVIASKMISLVSGKIASQISKDYNIAYNIVQKSADNAEGKFNITFTKGEYGQESTIKMVDYLHRNNKLSHSVIINALCHNNLRFFYYGISKLAGVSYNNVVKIIEQGQERGFESLFFAASMPSSLCKASYILVATIKELSPQNIAPNMFNKFLSQKIIEQGYDKTVPNMRYVLALINSQ